MRLPLPGELWSVRFNFGSHGRHSRIPADSPFLVVSNNESAMAGKVLLMVISNGHRNMEVYMSLDDIYPTEL